MKEHHPAADAFEALCEEVARWRRADQRVVLCHGCFDPVHVGHVYHLREARRMGDRLVVTLTDDENVREQKGPSRPLIPGADRLEHVRELRCVDAAALNLWPTAVETIRRIQPHVYCKGDDYAPGEDMHARVLEEKRAVEEVDGVLRFTRGPRWSGTEIGNWIRSRL